MVKYKKIQVLCENCHALLQIKNKYPKPIIHNKGSISLCLPDTPTHVLIHVNLSLLPLININLSF